MPTSFFARFCQWDKKLLLACQVLLIFKKNWSICDKSTSVTYNKRKKNFASVRVLFRVSTLYKTRSLLAKGTT
jgi:hypothetical protein